MTRPTLVIFARAPAIGVGKSRLARDVGRVEAWRLYRAMSSGLTRRLADPRWRTVTRIAPDRAATRFAGTEPQGGGDLGRKLERAIRAHAAGPVAVVGTDCPDVDAARVWKAFRACRVAGAALGPAEDGGFWILALSARRARTVSLNGVRWSTPHAFEDTRAALGGEVSMLERLVDVDDLASLRAIWARAPRAGG